MTRPIRKIQRLLEPAVTAAVVILGLLFLITVAVVYFAEHGTNPRFESFRSALAWVFFTLVSGQPWTVQTVGGKVMTYVVGTLKPISVAILTAALTSHLFQLIVRRSSGMGRTRARNHILICGWSGKGSEIIREVRSRESGTGPPAPIVVLAPLANSPTKDEFSAFVAGDPTSAAALKRAGVEVARVAIVLADNSYPDIDVEDMDSRTLLTTLAIESLNPGCYTCVEVVQSANREHFARTKADELVVSAHLTGALLAHSAMAPGVSRVLDDLLTYPAGDELYWVDLPSSWTGRRFDEVLGDMKRTYDCVSIAVSRAGVYRTNPPADFVIQPDDRLLVVAKAQPVIA